MAQNNLQRMIKLAEEFFDVKNDPEQISVGEETARRLAEIHPATMTEERTDDGPIAWMLLIPTTHEVMERFLGNEITERQLLDQTLPGATYDALYLCSALVLPEYRGKGIARRLALRAVRAIQHDHPIKELFYWEFSNEGRSLAEKVAKEVGLPLRMKKEKGKMGYRI